LTLGFRQAVLVVAGAAFLLAVFVLSNSANRAFVRMLMPAAATNPRWPPTRSARSKASERQWI
jgi:hypothetical protein